MSFFGDDGNEMPRPGSFDDDAIDALLSGSAPAGDPMGSFVEDLRAAAVAVPTPSPVLAAAIVAGGISTHQPQDAKWRKFQMKIKGLLAGLGIAGKVALGVGVAAAATTGAGAAGVLPGPVQHAVSRAVDAVTPFSLPDPDHHPDRPVAGGDATTTTTVADVTTTTAVEEPHRGDGGERDHEPVVSPTTVAEHHDVVVTTTTVAEPVPADGATDGHEVTPTTAPHSDGDSNNPESLSIHCERATEPARIVCTWTASTLPDHARYVLLRTGDGSARVVFSTEAQLHFTDTLVTPGVSYTYRVDSLRADGSVSSHSAAVTVECCGAVPPLPTTTTTVHLSDGTTTTTIVK